MIVFGHNNFKIKSFTPEEVGIPQEDASTKVSLEIRQRYAHLFWIPFFPIGKMWVIRRENSTDFYKMPDAMKKAILEQIDRPKTPWYSFTLLLLGVLAGIIALISEAQRSQRWEDDFYNSVEKNKMLIEYPTTGDCYILERYANNDTWEYDKIILKVKEYNEKSITFVSLYNDLYKDAETDDKYDYHESFDIAELENHNPITIKKENLKPALNQEYREKHLAIEIQPLDGLFKLENIDRRMLED